MTKKKMQWLDPILAIGVLVSIAIGFSMVVLGNDTVSSLIVGLLSTIITLLVDAVARIQELENTTIESARLSHLLSDGPFAEELRKIGEIYLGIKKFGFDYYDTLAMKAVADAKPRLLELASGSVSVSVPTDYEYHGTDIAQKNIKTIHTIPMGFWDSEFGRAFLERNKAAVKRGVRITRIFALTTEMAKESINRLREQETAGIAVIIVKPGERTKQEFTIFDDETLVLHELDSNQRYKADIVVRDPERVKRKVAEFENLISMGRSISDVQP